jgi:hypothetical protein
MIAYGHWGALTINLKSSWSKAFDCPVKPFFTLFCLKSKSSYEEQCDVNSPVMELDIDEMAEEGIENWFKSVEYQWQEYQDKRGKQIEKVAG